MEPIYRDVLPTEGLEVQVGLLLEGMEVTTREWREELGEVSEEALIWQPIPNGHSIGAILLHITDVEAFWIHQVAGGRVRTEEELKRLLSEETDQYRGRWPSPPKQPLSWYLAQMDEIRARTREVAQEINAPEKTGLLWEQVFTFRWLLHHVMTHEAYHGGQAVLLALLHNAQQ